MTYERAKELKEAGFPHPGSIIVKPYSGDPVSIPTPTLSELIEACGDGFDSLTNFGSEQWEALGNTVYVSFGEELQAQHMGKTPEEAVAKLWLALNQR